MSFDYLGLVRRVDDLYQAVVTDPEDWTELAFGDWAAELFSTPPPKGAQREVRRAIRVAQKLAAFWSDPDRVMVSDAGDWRTRVDVAQGSRAWRPTLALARLGLDDRGGADLYEEVKRRFRQVHSQTWMEGVAYEDWAGANPTHPRTDNADRQ